MSVFTRRGIPYFAAVGNHDRKHRPGFPEGVDPMGDLSNYMQVFADRPYPFGDAPPPSDRRFAPRGRPASDPAGASSHFSFQYGRTRWVFLDNSCFSFLNCDPLQHPPFPDPSGAQDTFDLIAREGAAAKRSKQRLFVVLHMPTQDPRPEHTEPTPLPHTMGEGSSPDNLRFEQAAAAAGVDGVFAGHIKGQFIYRAQGVPYFIDGGAGGEVYVGPREETGVDYGYWHGYRLIRVARGRVTTDLVPVFAGRIQVRGPRKARRGRVAAFSGSGKQPTQEGPEVNLELRRPDPDRPNAANLPAPSFIWTTSNARILSPLAAEDDDPRRVRRRQTVSGKFRARCPGRTRVRLTSGFKTAGRKVVVPSRRGKLIRSVRAPSRVINPGSRVSVAVIQLAQHARVVIEVRSGGKRISLLRRRCQSPADLLTAFWNGRRTNGRQVARGAYSLVVRIRSDRPDVVKRFRLLVR